MLKCLIGIYSKGCDLAAAAKPWPIHREVVNLLNKEFFAQGDRERIELNIEPNVSELDYIVDSINTKLTFIL